MTIQPKMHLHNWAAAFWRVQVHVVHMHRLLPSLHAGLLAAGHALSHSMRLSCPGTAAGAYSEHLAWHQQCMSLLEHAQALTHWWDLSHTPF